MNRTALKLAAGLLFGAALSASAVALAARDAANARLATVQIMLATLASWDSIHQRHEPHDAFTRPAKRLDPRPLSVQARDMWRALDERFLTYGGRLLLTTTPPVEINDLCIWQGVYTGISAIDYARRRDAPSQRRVELAFDGLRLMLSRGRPIARAVLPADIKTEPPGRWYYRSADWQWKEDASIDSAAGWVFGTVLVLELVPSRRQEALDALKKYADVIIDGKLHLRNSDGRRTRFSAVGGDFVSSPVGVLTTIAVLRALERRGVPGPYGRVHARMLEAGQDLWGAYATAPALWRNETTNHNIAYLALAAAMLEEDDPGRWKIYARGLLRLETLTERMGNSFWIYLAEWTFQQKPKLTSVVSDDVYYRKWASERRERFRRARVSMLEFDYPRMKEKRLTRNSAREDLDFARWGGIGPRESAQPLPVHERPATDFVWQRSPYQLDGWVHIGHAGLEFAPLDFLSAYSLGRSVGALSAVD